MIFLDNGATSFPKPESVYKFMDEFYRRAGVNPGRSGYDICLEAGDLMEQTRELAAKFFGAPKAERLGFCYNASDALNMIIFGMLKRGDHAVSTTLEHNSVLRPLYHLSEDEGVEVDYVPFEPDGFMDPEKIRARFKKNTRLVVVNHGSNVIGTIQPIRAIGKLCRERGIPFAIDTSQSAGHVPIDIVNDGVDMLAFTGHKGLLGPTGIGGLYVGEGIELRQTRAGGTGIRSIDRRHPPEYPYRLEHGTPNIMGVAGLNAGIKWLEEQGYEKLHRQEMALTTMLRDGLRTIEGVTMYCQDDLAGHLPILSFNVAGFEALDTGTLLDADYDIACRTGLHCAPRLHEQLGTAEIKGSVRFGIGPFNTEEHIRAAVHAVGEIAAMSRSRK